MPKRKFYDVDEAGDSDCSFKNALLLEKFSFMAEGDDADECLSLKSINILQFYLKRWRHFRFRRALIRSGCLYAELHYNKHLCWAGLRRWCDLASMKSMCADNVEIGVLKCDQMLKRKGFAIIKSLIWNCARNSRLERISKRFYKRLIMGKFYLRWLGKWKAFVAKRDAKIATETENKLENLKKEFNYWRKRCLYNGLISFVNTMRRRLVNRSLGSVAALHRSQVTSTRALRWWRYVVFKRRKL